MLLINEVAVKTAKDGRAYKVCKLSAIPSTLNNKEVITALQERQATIVVWETTKQGVKNPSYPRAEVGAAVAAKQFSTSTAPYTVDGRIVTTYSGVQFDGETEQVAMQRSGFIVNSDGQYAPKVKTAAPTAAGAFNPVVEKVGP